MAADEEVWIAHQDTGRVYTYLKTPPKNLVTTFPMLDHYPEIEQEDIDRGSIMRYFARQSNHSSGDITEVDERTYQRLSTNPLYKTVELSWKITGKIDDIMGPPKINSPVRLFTGVATANRLAVEEADKEMPGLRYKLTHFTQFWVETDEA
jgi:hypothetical protein